MFRRKKIETPALVDTHNVVPMYFHAPWDYRPIVPVRLQTWHESLNPTQADWAHYPSVEAAMIGFRRHSLPVKRGYWSFLIDSDFFAVFGYDATERLRREFGSTGWYGVEQPFRVAEQIRVADPLDILGWEVLAQTTAGASA